MSRRTQSQIIRRTRVPLDKILPNVVANNKMTAVGGAVSPGWQRLSCNVPHQEQSNWCWCATTLGVHKFYDTADSTSQCVAANKILGRTDGCTNPSGSDVNVVYHLDKALATFGHIRNMLGNPLQIADVEKEILGKAPICTRVGWAGGGGHFMVIEGILNGPTPRIAINDPIFGRTDIDYLLYLTAYQGKGSWTHSYFTK